MTNVPSPNEIEISVFGPGIGEAIAFHYNNNWILIDSCIDQKTNKPASLNYLQSLSVDLKTSVKLIILTHWHDDHIRGASEMIQKCPNARIVLSDALKNDDFLQLAVIYSKRKMVLPNGFDEFTKILQQIRDDDRDLKFGSVDKALFHDSTDM